jgi:hypothetical protein
MSEELITSEVEERELLASAARAGAEVSAHQLKRWRRAGLIPRPRVVHASGVRGSMALYPVWAVEQLIAVARLHRTVRGLSELVIAVWWEGHWVAIESLRAALVGPLQQLSDEARVARGGGHDPYEAADQMIVGLKDDGPPSKATALIRSRLSSRADFLDLLWTFLVIGLGGQAPWEQEDRSRPDPAPGALALLAKATGVDRAMQDDPAGNGPWLPADFDLPAFIAELRDAGAFDLEDAARPIREASRDQLAQAHEDALLLSGPLALIGTVLEGLLGQDVGGMGSLGALDPDSSSARACLVRSVLILRPLAGDAAFSAIAELVASVHDRYVAIAELRAALPQHAGILRADYADRLAALPPAQAEVVRADVAGVLGERPDLAATLASGQQPASPVEVAGGEVVALVRSA